MCENAHNKKLRRVLGDVHGAFYTKYKDQVAQTWTVLRRCLPQEDVLNFLGLPLLLNDLNHQGEA